LYLSFEQLIFLLLLAFILFGPEKLPEYAAKLGRLVAKLRQVSQEMAQQVQNPLSQTPPPPPQIPARRTCLKCRQELDSTFSFCPHCGQHLQEEPGPPEASPYYGGQRGPRPLPAAEGPGIRPLAEAETEIRPLTEAEAGTILEVINDAARAYYGVIPADCWKEPYMPREELEKEMAAGVKFWGFAADGKIVGVMGRQDLLEVTLIRHAYVRSVAQRQGAGARLLAHLRQGVTRPVLVGTWEAAWWATWFYEKHGFKLVSPEEKDRLLRTYWSISHRQIETSVVLADEAWFSRQGSGV
jgi:Sec-independent protein translocase protein TatA/N-acetylglutamate synthase-like GNAT family acetyltransferase